MFGRGSAITRATDHRMDVPFAPLSGDSRNLFGQAGEQVSGIYEADYRDFNRETYARGRETFDATYAAFGRARKAYQKLLKLQVKIVKETDEEKIAKFSEEELPIQRILS